MAKTKAELHSDAVKAGLVPDDTSPDDYTGDQLQTLLGSDVPAAGWVASADKPIVAPDGHVTLSQEDIDARS